MGEHGGGESERNGENSREQREGLNRKGCGISRVESQEREQVAQKKRVVVNPGNMESGEIESRKKWEGETQRGLEIGEERERKQGAENRGLRDRPPE